MSEDEAQADLARLTPIPAMFNLWNYEDCDSFEDAQRLNHYATIEIAKFIERVTQSKLPEHVEGTAISLTLFIENYRMLVWPQKEFFINEVLKIYKASGIIPSDYMHSSIQNGTVSAEKNSEISTLLEYKFQTERIRRGKE